MSTRRPVGVLIIDDDDDIRATLAEVFEDLGYTTATAGNGAEALELLKSVEPKLILLDLSMPVMSGQEFRAAQSADPAIAHIPTIVMTAADRATEKAAHMNVAEVLGKPIRMQTLVERAQRYCSS